MPSRKFLLDNCMWPTCTLWCMGWLKVAQENLFLQSFAAQNTHISFMLSQVPLTRYPRHTPIICLNCVALGFKGWATVMPIDWLIQSTMAWYWQWCHIWVTWWCHQGHLLWQGISENSRLPLMTSSCILLLDQVRPETQAIPHNVNQQNWGIELHHLQNHLQYQPTKLTCQVLQLKQLMIKTVEHGGINKS